ncbi:unnamed protein product [Blepharisma stoltei]|uniref:Probable imidazolonepropionase n=1 Tax=Blepharisma stoltei TaxID=1481888 RepID=A0AAU9K0L1_9CILI|nr:unnamed protein product [Blepharisma stoltei]
MILINHIRQIVCISDSYQSFKIGTDMSNLHIIEDGAIIIQGERIYELGSSNDILSHYSPDNFTEIYDASDMCLIPGLVDAHTHVVFSGDRVHEFAMKLEGKSYMEIQAAGGGITFTTSHVRESSEEELYNLLIPRLDRMLAFGTTLAEAKSGYGLELDSEVKMLKVIKKANEEHTIDLVATYLPGHAVNPGKTAQEMVDDIVNHQIPVIKQLKDNGEINPEMIDVFCEKNVYEIEETKAILEAGKRIGLEANFHGEEIEYLESGVLAASVKARAMSHLENLSEQAIPLMAEAGVIGVLLPTTQYLLHLKTPPARSMIANGVPVAIGTDFNPNMWCLSMPLAMHMACVNYRLSMAEALVASTLNAAASMGRSQEYGSIEPRKYADLVFIKAERWEHLIYQMADPPIAAVWKKGKIVIDKYDRFRLK